MRRLGLTPDDVLAAYDEWMADLQAQMVPAGRGARKQNSTLHSPPSTLKKRHKAGDYAVLPAVCPACGGDVELLQLCHLASPIWRTQLACMADACVWHGKSRLPIDALLARGTLKDSVECGVWRVERASFNSTLHTPHSTLKKTEG